MQKKLLKLAIFRLDILMNANHLLKLVIYVMLRIINRKKLKIITTYGSLKWYQADIWYLSDELKKGSPYLYVLDL